MQVKVWDVLTKRTRWVESHQHIATCGQCGRSWDDSVVTHCTPAPSARCPFEGMKHIPYDMQTKKEA